MKMTTCGSCHRLAPVKANKCPHCKAPLKRRSDAWFFAVAVGGVVVLFLVYYLVR